LVLAFGNAGRNIKDHFAEAGIMAAALLQSIGSNILAFQLCAPVFWFAFGQCMCNDDDKPIR
nr:hypothetical protein [Lachnospiraceae bacterium]